MLIRSIILISLSFFNVLYAMVETVELVANFPIDPARYTAILTKNHFPDVRVVSSDLSQYGVGFKNHRLEKFLHKWSLDFWRSISVRDQVKKIIFFNMTNRYRRDIKFRYLPKDKLILFMWEPPLVLHHMYKKNIAQAFSAVYTWDDDLVDGVTFFKFHYPELQPMIPDTVDFEKKKLCTFVGSCWSSRRRGSLYEERKKAIAFFENIGEQGFEFYGKRWDPALYRSYRGPIEDKIQTIKKYRFYLCYENSCDRNGYVTEKIFDCFAAGCVPLYWGAPNIEKYIPKDCFIDVRDFINLEELYSFIKNMSKEEYEGYITRIRLFLKSDKAQVFSWTQFEQTFCEAVTR